MFTYQLSDQQVSTSVAGETVILQFNSGEYYNLNSVGSFVWGLLHQKPHTLAQIIEGVCSNFEIDSLQCQGDIEELLLNLENEKLLTKNQ